MTDIVCRRAGSDDWDRTWKIIRTVVGVKPNHPGRGERWS